MQDKIIVLNGKSINLKPALPLVLKDWRELEEKGIDPNSLSSGKVSQMIGLVFHVLHKADPTVTIDDIESLAITDPAIQGVINSINDQEEQSLDRPS